MTLISVVWKMGRQIFPKNSRVVEFLTSLYSARNSTTFKQNLSPHFPYYSIFIIPPLPPFQSHAQKGKKVYFSRKKNDSEIIKNC
jgi:hypothetical protein